MTKHHKNYKEMSEELAEIIAWFESEDVDLDSATVKYEQATELINKMETYLKDKENKIHKVKTSQEK